MIADERERRIFELMQGRGSVSFQELDARLDASPATIRRDLERLAREGRLTRVRGGARLMSEAFGGGQLQFHCTPLNDSSIRHVLEKAVIGKAAAGLCAPGEAVMIAGGTTTLHMCANLNGLNLQVLTNSLHVLGVLLPQPGTNILLPSGAVFRDQAIVLDTAGADGMPRFHAPRLFIGAASIGPQGVMQNDPVLVAAERRLIERADEIVLLADSSKFQRASGHVVCDLHKINTVVTDANVSERDCKMLENAGARVVIAH